MEGKHHTAVYMIIACLFVAAIGEMAYLHLKVISLHYETSLLAGLQKNTRRDLKSLINAIHEKTWRGQSDGMNRQGKDSDLDSVNHELHRMIRFLLTRKVSKRTRKSVLAATENPNKKMQNYTNLDIPMEVKGAIGTKNSIDRLDKKGRYSTIKKSEEKQSINRIKDANNIVEISLSSKDENHSKRQIRVDSCVSSEKGMTINIHVNIDSDGNCHCIAKHGKNKSFADKSSNPPPRVFLPASKIKGTIGIPLELQCNFTEGHRQTIKWKKDGKEILGEQFFTADNHSLKVRISDPSMKDNGNYSCHIENDIGTDEKSIQVTFIEKDCSAWKKKGYIDTGVYAISPDGGQSFEVYCDMETDGGGWNVIQRREDGSVDFFKPWDDYKNGFGNISGEFWLGNDKIHRLTESMDMSIRFDLVDSDGKQAFAEYEIFYVGDESDEYRLYVESYSGTAGDSFLYHSGMKFSTKDKGHTIFGARCAKRFRGAWWYRACHRSNLNGQYLSGRRIPFAEGIKWMTLNGDRGSLVQTEMKLRPFKDGSKT